MNGMVVRTTYLGQSDYSWLGTANSKVLGFDSGELDVGLFRDAGLSPHEVIVSGTPVGRVTRGDRLGPFDPEASDGREVLFGFVRGDEHVRGRDRARCEVLVRGPVRADRLRVSVPAEAFEGTDFVALRDV